MSHHQPRSPIAVRMMDVDQPLTRISGLSGYTGVRVFVMRSEVLLGSFEILTDGAEAVSVGRLKLAVAADFSTLFFKEEVARSLRTQPSETADAVHALLEPQRVSVIVPSCERPDDLRQCLHSLASQRTRHAVEIVVVDNRPTSPTTADVVREFPSVRLVTEMRPGLSYARNAGITAATGEIIVATDDDVVAPPDWIEKLLKPFGRSEVMCVTGNVLPLALETESQCLFEEYGGLGKGYVPREYDGHWFRSQPGAPPTWWIGATANAAFRASCFRNPAIGLLDEALGAGMPTGCSEDTYLFYRIVKSGGTIVYAPSAFVWHRHRTSMTSLRHQIYSYSKGHVAYHLTTLMKEGERRALHRLATLPFVHLKRIYHRLRGWSDYPVSLVLLEVQGNLAGPFALWRARRRVRRLRPSNKLPEHAHAVQLESPLSQDPQT
ncbi:MAG: glycosyltransferase [Vicinamibacterales bacterium]